MKEEVLCVRTFGEQGDRQTVSHKNLGGGERRTNARTDSSYAGVYAAVAAIDDGMRRSE